VSATPNRGGNIGLRELFFNVADQIRLGELIAADCLVAPRTFVIDVGVQDELRNVRCNGDDFDMHDVARVMDTVVARNRRTIWGGGECAGVSGIVPDVRIDTTAETPRTAALPSVSDH
jgi:hypothetical protein